ncbi:MAG: hypothetical protein MUP57_02775, partial [Clostridia bacterium]|nr:hypothetical protein [Clostridia bacterium]
VLDVTLIMQKTLSLIDQFSFLSRGDGSFCFVKEGITDAKEVVRRPAYLGVLKQKRKEPSPTLPPTLSGGVGC